ncbi:MAG: DNA helicase [Pseudomonadota bacterium]
MRLTAPIYLLKRQARLLSREQSLPLHQALDQVARSQGFRNWSLLARKLAARQPTAKVFAALHNGDMMLIGGRAGQGKTTLGVELAIAAMNAGQRAFFFSLEYTQADIAAQFSSLGHHLQTYTSLFEFDASDAICAAYIQARLKPVHPNTLVVIDYLQLLDQRRSNPAIAEQVASLKQFAQQRDIRLVFLAQIDRRYQPGKKPLPDLSDVRLPNPLDLSLFNKTCFLQAGELSLANNSN